ncbi:hypothetical protein AJ78_06501 [Emergomyces pasteurianus Ep9510]|uniref:DNA recombination and repair protein Rad51-like C-terminal domain-containing protein n=1 Tax=Emergomyces pasteurianus Ep9510 TaxID=1447872 RepID=A0A1J9PAK7_9EURO|nr:hypothetical protein AJ78_06501 [Emergomyces pasteurianus Ep9510]
MTGQFAPAPPILASALLDSSIQIKNGHYLHEQRGMVENASWDLTRDIEEGISLTSDKSVLSCGRIIGISGFQSAAAKRGDDIRSWVNEFSQYILVTLLSKYPAAQKFPRAFVIQYFDSRPLSPQALYSSLQQRLPDCPSEDIESILESIQTRRVYDFEELVEAVSQASDILFEVQQWQNQPEHQKQGNSSAPILLLIEGIDQSLEETIRISNPVAGRAQLTSLLRTLTVLSRTCASFLCVIIVNSIALLHIPSTTSAQEPTPNDSYAGQRPPHQLNRQPQQHPQQLFRPGLVVNSIFSNVRRCADRPSKLPPFSTPFSILAQSLDQGCDVHLLVSQVQENMIIEVGKHRVGDEVGRWCELSTEL